MGGGSGRSLIWFPHLNQPGSFGSRAGDPLTRHHNPAELLNVAVYRLLKLRSDKGGTTSQAWLTGGGGVGGGVLA